MTAAFWVRPVDTWVTWVSLLGRGSFTGEETPIPQKKTELRAGGLADRASTTVNNGVLNINYMYIVLDINIVHFMYIHK